MDEVRLSIKGFKEVSFLDWDGKVSAVLWVPYCNFRCPFCYNVDLLLHPEDSPDIPWEKIERYLKREKGFIDGVVITGGEPFFHKDLSVLTKKIKDLGLLVKVDSNGSFPQRLKEMIEKGLVDYLAMDIKAPLKKTEYQRASGTKGDILKEVKESIKIIMNSGVDYEFRTTVVPTIHNEDSILQIGKEIAGAKKFVLQNFFTAKTLDPSFSNLTPYPLERLQKMAKLLSPYLKNVSIRGR